MLKTLGPVLGVEVRLWDEGFLREQFLANLVLILSSWGTKMGWTSPFSAMLTQIITVEGWTHFPVNFPIELVEDILRNTTGLFLWVKTGFTANIFSSNKKMVQLRAVHR